MFYLFIYKCYKKTIINQCPKSSHNNGMFTILDSEYNEESFIQIHF